MIDILLVALLFLVPGVAVALYWWDVVAPRRHRRERRRQDRWRAKFRSSILADTWKRGKTPRITDQRRLTS
jgi:hypothetical protein